MNDSSRSRAGSATAAASPPVRTNLGLVTFTPVQPEHYATLHEWLTAPHAGYWLMQESRVEDVAQMYDAMADDEYQHAYVGALGGEPLLLVEIYDPAHRELVGKYEAQPGDLGMHVLVAPPTKPRTGTTDAIMTAIVQWCFTTHGAARVVVEPDQTNDKIRAKNRAVGFVEHDPLDMGHKTAILSTCTAQQFTQSPLGSTL